MIQFLAVTRSLRPMHGHRQYITPQGGLWRRVGVSPPTDIGAPPKPTGRVAAKKGEVYEIPARKPLG